MIKKRIVVMRAGVFLLFILCLSVHSTTTQNQGVILTFHQWPSPESQKKLTKALNIYDLTLSKSFKNFKTLVFQWSAKNTPPEKAQFVCGLLESYRFLKSCQANSRLVPQKNTLPLTPTEASTLCLKSDSSSSCLKNQTNVVEEVKTLKKQVEENLPVCELTRSRLKLKSGTLSDFWAQELVGADLVREELKKAPPLPEDYKLIAVLDDFKKKEAPLTPVNEPPPPPDPTLHGISVRNLISSDREGVSVLPALHPGQIDDLHTHLPSETLEVTGLLKNKQVSFINYCLGPTQKPGLLNQKRESEHLSIENEAFKSLPDSIIVNSAGNWFMKPIPEKHIQSPNMIIVGSFSPAGLVSGFSQSDSKVSVLAPSDYYITSLNNEGEYESFGGTSGASPLVTGALAAFEWLSGHHPSPEEAKHLLEQTAIPTLESVFENPPRNGAGILNAYKLARVAQRLKNRCQTNTACLRAEIQNTDLYQFPKNDHLYHQIATVFPECAKNQAGPLPRRAGVRGFSCNHKKTVLNALRREFLLFPQDPALLNHLSCIYRSRGLTGNAQMFETLNLASRGKQKIIEAMELQMQALGPESNKETTGDKIAIIRFLTNFPTEERTRRVLTQTAFDEHPLVKKILAQTATHNNDPDILNTLSEDNDPSVRTQAALFQIQNGNPNGKRVLENLLKDINRQAGPLSGIEVAKESFIDPQLLSDTALKLGEEGEWLTLALATSPHRDIRIQAVEPAINLPAAQGTMILDRLARDPDQQVREKVLQLAIQTQGENAVSALKIMAQSPSKPLRQEIEHMISDYQDFIKSMEGEFRTRTIAPADVFQIRQNLLKAGAKYGKVERYKVKRKKTVRDRRVKSVRKIR